MQRGEVNHILLGIPIKTFLVLAHSAYHPNFPVSLSFPGEGTSSMSPAAALGKAGNRAWDSSTNSELPPQHCFMPDSAPAGASQQRGLLQDKAPAQSQGHPKGCAQRGALLQMAGVWISQGHAEPPDPQQNTAGHWGMGSAMSRCWAGDTQWLADSQHQLGSDALFQGKMSWIEVSVASSLVPLLGCCRQCVILAPAGACESCCVPGGGWSHSGTANLMLSLWQLELFGCKECFQDPFGSENGTFLAGRMISILEVFLTQKVRIVWIICLDADLQTALEKEVCICCAVTSHTALVEWTHCGARRLDTEDPLGMDTGSFWKQNEWFYFEENF